MEAYGGKMKDLAKHERENGLRAVIQWQTGEKV